MLIYALVSGNTVRASGVFPRTMRSRLGESELPTCHLEYRVGFRDQSSCASTSDCSQRALYRKPRNALGRAVFFNRLGEMHRSFENQRYRASGLNLVTAAIVLRNTVYLERPIQVIKERGQPVDENLLQHVSPLAWEHINLTGDYVWRQTRRVEKGKLRPLRPFPRA
jgi:hypothetical protein